MFGMLYSLKVIFTPSLEVGMMRRAGIARMIRLTIPSRRLIIALFVAWGLQDPHP